MMCVYTCLHVSQHSADAWRSRARCTRIALAACLMQCHCQWTIESTVMSVWLSFEAPLSISFVARVKLNSLRHDCPEPTPLKHPPAVGSNVRITLLPHMALKRNVRTINSSKYAMDEIIETMFIIRLTHQKYPPVLVRGNVYFGLKLNVVAAPELVRGFRQF